MPIHVKLVTLDVQNEWFFFVLNFELSKVQLHQLFRNSLVKSQMQDLERFGSFNCLK